MLELPTPEVREHPTLPQGAALQGKGAWQQGLLPTCAMGRQQEGREGKEWRQSDKDTISAAYFHCDFCWGLPSLCWTIIFAFHSTSLPIPC